MVLSALPMVAHRRVSQMSNGSPKSKRCIIKTDTNEGTLSFHEPVPAPAGSKAKWVAGDLIRVIKVDDYSPEMQRIAMVTTGFRNKFMDTYADPARDIAESLEDQHQSLLAGQWSARGESAERTTLFVQAYAAVKGQTVDYVRGRVNAIESGDDEVAKATLAQWRKDNDILAKMAEIQILNAQKRLAAAQEAPKAEEKVDL